MHREWGIGTHTTSTVLLLKPGIIVTLVQWLAFSLLSKVNGGQSLVGDPRCLTLTIIINLKDTMSIIINIIT